MPTFFLVNRGSSPRYFLQCKASKNSLQTMTNFMKQSYKTNLFLLIYLRSKKRVKDFSCFLLLWLKNSVCERFRERNVKTSFYEEVYILKLISAGFFDLDAPQRMLVV